MVTNKVSGSAFTSKNKDWGVNRIRAIAWIMDGREHVQKLVIVENI